MFKKPTKRQFIIRRVLLSTIATFSVIIIATVTILFMLGYRLDSGNGHLEQGALLQFDSIPNGGDVFVDGTNTGNRTASKHTVVAGVHTVKMTKSGYEDWSRTLDLAAGTLTWLDYTRFVPTNRPVATVTTYQSLVGVKISPDSKWAIAQERADSPNFSLVDLRSEDVKSSTLILPTSAYSDATTVGVTHSFSIVSWDSGGRFVLVKHLHKDQTEWIVLDTQNSSQAVNITQVFNTGFKDVQFAGTSGKVLYGLTNDGTVRKIDLSGETLSRAFITHADSFSIFDNTIISYVGIDPSDATKRVAGVYRDGDEAAHVLRSVVSTDVVLKIATGRFYGNDYVAIAEGNVVTVLKGTYPNSSSQDTSSLAKYATCELTGTASALSISPNGDYVFAQSGAKFMSYDIEHTRSAVGTIVVAEGQAASTLRWLDDDLVWNDDNGTLMMRDFTGDNVYSIMTTQPGFDASLSQNGRFFYAVGKDEKGYHIQRVKMILD